MSSFAGTWTLFKIRSFGDASPIENGTPISFTDDSGGNPIQLKFTATGKGEITLSTSKVTGDTVEIERDKNQGYRALCQILSAGRLSFMLGLVSFGTERGGVGDSNTDSFVAVKTSG